MTARVPSLSSVMLRRPAASSERSLALAGLSLERDSAPNATARARLFHELGQLHEQLGNWPEAIQHYLSATNLEPSYLAPLEALVVSALRRDSSRNLSPFLERLAQLARSEDEREQAFLLLAELQRREGNLEKARQSLESWLGEFPQGKTPWFALDILEGKSSPALVERARTGRAGTAHDPLWRSLLLLDCAALRAQQGDANSAFDLCRQATDECPTLFAWAFWERTALRLGRHAEASAAAEGASRLVGRAIQDHESAARLHVAPWQRHASYAGTLLVRAAEWARRDGDMERASTLFERCAKDNPGELLPRLALLLTLEETPGPRLLQQLLEEIRSAGSSRIGSLLWLDVARLARHDGNAAAVQEAAARAVQLDGESLCARALSLHVLEQGEQPDAYANAVENTAPWLGSTQADWLLFAALLRASSGWSVGDGRSPRATIWPLLQKAREAGAPPLLVAHLGAALARPAGDSESSKESMRALMEFGSEEERVDAAWTLLRRQVAEANFSAPSVPAPSLPTDTSELLPSTLRALVLPLWTGQRAPEDSAEWERLLAERGGTQSLLRAARWITLRRLLERGETQQVRDQLRRLLEETPDDLIAAAALADLLTPSDPISAANVLTRAGRSQPDSTLRGAWLLRASRLLWQAGQQAEALLLVTEVETNVPRVARPWLMWGERYLLPNDLAARTRWLDQSPEDRGHFVALERLVLSARTDPHTARTYVPGPSEQDASLRWLGALLAATQAASASPDPWPAFEALPSAPLGLGAALALGRILEERSVSPEEVLTRAELWASSPQNGPESVDAGLAWLAASRRAGNLESEVLARAHLGARLGAHELTAAATLLAWLIGSPARDELAFELAKTMTDASHASLQARAANWALLELYPPGRDFEQRAATLERLGLGKLPLEPEAGGDASSVGTLLCLAGTNYLRAGNTDAAAELFRRATQLLPDDVGPWEGLRATAHLLKNSSLEVEACTELARRTLTDDVAAALWERVGILAQDDLDDEARAEEAFSAALARDPARTNAFTRMFLMVRRRSDTQRLLELVEGRLGAIDEPHQIEELLWEKARLTRSLGQDDRALRALSQLRKHAPNHLGALALTSELCLRKDLYEEAAEALTLIALHGDAPAEPRLLSGLAAADIYERRDKPKQAASALRALHAAGLADRCVIERLGLAQLKASQFAEAATTFEELLDRAGDTSQRATAAQFLLALYRDQLPSKQKAVWACQRLLAEHPTDADALMFLLEELEPEERQPFVLHALERLREVSLHALLGPSQLRLTALLAQDLGWKRTALAAHGALHLLGELDEKALSELSAWNQHACHKPTRNEPLSPAELLAIAHAEEQGPFFLVADQLSKAASLGFNAHPQTLLLAGLEGSMPNHALSSPAVADELIAWSRLFGLPDLPMDAPLTCQDRGRAVIALYAIARGIAPLILRKEPEAATVLAAAAGAVGLDDLKDALGSDASADQLEEWRYRFADLDEATLRELEQVLVNAPRSREAFTAWYYRARMSTLRMALLAVGEPASLRPLVEELRGELGEADDSPLRDIISFALSAAFIELREALGLEEP